MLKKFNCSTPTDTLLYCVSIATNINVKKYLPRSLGGILIRERFIFPQGFFEMSSKSNNLEGIKKSLLDVF